MRRRPSNITRKFLGLYFKGIVAVLCGFVVDVMVRGVHRIVVLEDIRQRDGSVDRQDRAEKNFQDKDGVL